jgi:hypothetical protein
MINADREPCPDIGVWRAWLDNEDHPTHLDNHLAGCPACQRMVADLRDDAHDVNTILSVLAPTRLPSPAEVAVARERLDWRRARGAPRLQPADRPSLEPIPMFFSHLTTPWRVAASGVAAALAITLLVAFTPQGSSVAAAFLSQFRSQQVTAIEISPQTQGDIMKTLTALGNLGTVQAAGVTADPARPEAAVKNAEGQTKTVSLAEAAQTVGFPLVTPDPSTLPAGVDKTPHVRVMPGTQVRFTFDKNKAQTYFQANGHPEVNLPDKFNGATLTVSIPSAAALEYGDPATKTGIVVAEAGEVVADVQGNVSLPELRDFLLGLPGMPPTVVSQLRQIQNWNDTLPIPVPVDQVHWTSTKINGNQALLLNDNSGVGSAAIWHANGHLFGVAGSVKATEIQRFAESLALR